MSEKRPPRFRRSKAYVIKAAETRPERVEPGPPSPPRTPSSSDTSLVRALQELLREDGPAPV